MNRSKRLLEWMVDRGVRVRDEPEGDLLIVEAEICGVMREFYRMEHKERLMSGQTVEWLSKAKERLDAIDQREQKDQERVSEAIRRATDALLNAAELNDGDAKVIADALHWAYFQGPKRMHAVEGKVNG